MAGTLVLLFTVPIVGKVVADIVADTNTGTTEKTVIGFVGTLYAIGVLIFCVRSFIQQAQGQHRFN
ncbi:MAG: hypothetical protein LC620_06520 [Halobacteriales archaeon]|nr:hypothetical protein [Halobacteriales archaeon]